MNQLLLRFFSLVELKLKRAFQVVGSWAKLSSVNTGIPAVHLVYVMALALNIYLHFHKKINNNGSFTRVMWSWRIYVYESWTTASLLYGAMIVFWVLQGCIYDKNISYMMEPFRLLNRHRIRLFYFLKNIEKINKKYEKVVCNLLIPK